MSYASRVYRTRTNTCLKCNEKDSDYTLEKTFHKDIERLEDMASAKYGVNRTEKFQVLFISHQSGIITVGLDNLKGLFQTK